MTKATAFVDDYKALDEAIIDFCNKHGASAVLLTSCSIGSLDKTQMTTSGAYQVDSPSGRYVLEAARQWVEDRTDEVTE